MDKKSFIRWKQSDIHQKREIMKQNIIRLEINSEISNELISRLERLIAAAEKSPKEYLSDIDLCVTTAQGDSKTQRPKTSSEAPTYNVMIENLIKQAVLKADEQDSATRATFFVSELKHHLSQIKEAREKDSQEYEKLIAERSRHILSEDLHTGFDSTLINKNVKEDPVPPSSSSSSSSSKKATTFEVLNPSTSSSQEIVPAQSAQQENAEDPDDVKASPDTVEFGNFKIGDYEGARRYLGSHPWIVNEREKDGLIMTAFESELAGDTKKTEQIVYNALLLQYCATLGRDGINLFFSRISQKNHPANDAFMKDVKFTYDHIKSRCKILKEKENQEEEQVEQIQLYSVDPNTQIAVHVPPSDSDVPEIQEARKVFEALSPELRKAIETQKLDEINKVLANMDVPEAEEAVRLLDECGALSVEEKIYDATKWEEEKREKLAKGEFSESLLREQEAKSKDTAEAVKAEPEQKPTFNSTIDEVD